MDNLRGLKEDLFFLFIFGYLSGPGTCNWSCQMRIGGHCKHEWLDIEYSMSLLTLRNSEKL